MIIQKLPSLRGIREGDRNIAGLHRLAIDYRFYFKTLFDQLDKTLQLGRLGFAEIENLMHRRVVIDRRTHALDDVVDVGVVTPGCPVAELVDRLAGQDFLRELMDGQVRPLPCTLNGKETKRHDPHLVKMRVSRAEKLSRDFRGRIRTDRLRKREVFRKRNFLADSIDR